MNLFATYADPVLSAQSLDDKRLNKITTESAQIICTVLHEDGIKNLPFKPTHRSHPAVIWAAETESNLYWVTQYHNALVSEWMYRRGKSHGSSMPEKLYAHVKSKKSPKSFYRGARNKARELDFLWIEDTHLAYRMYLVSRWLNDTHLPKWTKRKPPNWYSDFAFHDFDNAMLMINRAKTLIGSKKGGIIACPRCGGNIEYISKSEFHCVESNPWFVCLSWKELLKI